MSLKRLAPLAFLAVIAPATALVTPAEAQRRAVRQVVIFGNDPCPRGAGDEIVVCARRPESDRYRLPPDTRTPAPADRQSALERDQDHREAADFGTDSCSTVGPGGQTGCLIEQINRSRVGRDGNKQGNPPDGPNR
jgi:hypothetical protein